MSSKIHVRGAQKPEPFQWRRVSDGAAAAPETPGKAHAEARAQIGEEIEGRVREARQAGYREGYAAAKEEASGELRALGERVAQTIQELAQLRPGLRRQAEADLLRLALAIARRILHRELAVDPDAMRGLIQAALDQLQAREICRVRVHPSQEQAVRSLLASPGTEILADARLERGAAVFETTHGDLDASIDTQLREIESGLVDRLRRP
jgi:flagellar assembly protein FliH